MDQPSRASFRAPELAKNGMHYASNRRWLGRLRYQLVLGAFICALLPALIYYFGSPRLLVLNPPTVNTMSGGLYAFIIALFLFRRVISFPGVGLVAHVLPAVAAGYGSVLAVFFGLRLDYSGAMFLLSAANCTLMLLAISMALRSARGRRFYLVPSPRTAELRGAHDFEWVVLSRPEIPSDDDGEVALIADLRADLSPEWEDLIARAAVAGYPVYHVKQVKESLTGRVEIEHLSENSFGSLIPNLGYRKIKRAVDLATALVALPIFLPVGLVVALLIRLESPGPVLFRQQRRGYRGAPFEVIKFRTMRQRAVPEGGERQDAITRADDDRITRLGRFLRRSRLDEIPQVWNVLRGDMSWIGPRPEAMALSEWYMRELPFYTYRHIVRPGITGWAQINQGHVADLDGVFEKLHYDFYYIKNFSVWLDLVIVWRTVRTMMSGFGAR